ncbi:nucleotidyltransferase domain-containing protein [Ramlibacter sp. H39-3-26]|uniref:nucleotidyltransferase domain-containing protein n=1 Tax=Curvibacter soli TaxID=3031331 RepID=UPI0023DBEF61|nr:nucleotidyltransferase domain-containing protein [Ramlibacter sp. H39-3-26]MDF1485411.1 nucleotidyltransferase domain-containing protein [Ramlibacter sp. H39-3-26]
MPALFSELPLSAQTAYAQLRDVATAVGLERSITHLHGSFSKKTVKGTAYWYFAFRDIDGQVRQLYVGPDSDAVRAAVEQARGSPARPDATLVPLAKSAVALGCAGALPKHLRAVRRLAEYGFFRAGGVLIGTHAFIAIGNMLGLRWRAADRTTDVDFAHAGKNISVALPANVQIDVHGALASFEQGFIPLVQLGGDAGASYRRSGDAEFQLDFLTSPRLTDGGSDIDKPVRISNLNVALQPLRFMEFSLEQVEPAVLMDRNGASAMVTVPAPARYAVHKLLVVGERAGALRTKAHKDVQQAAALIEHMLQAQPDALHAAWQDALARGPDWRRRAEEGRAALQRAFPAIAAQWTTLATA